MKCAYCGEEAKGTKEHIISCGILDLFPECYITFDTERGITHQSDPVVKDVCANCNNQKLSYIDSYAKEFINQYFTKKYDEEDKVEIQYDYVMIQKMLLKYAFNDLRSHKGDISFFDDEIIHYLINENDNSPKINVTILCGLAVNVSPVPDAFMGNLKLRWFKNPILYSNTTIRHIDYETGKVLLNENVSKENFSDLRMSYVFRFNSVQFLLLCWDKTSKKIEENNIVLSYQFPYYLMKQDDGKVILPVCTNEINYHYIEHIHVLWDGLFQIGMMRKDAIGGEYTYKKYIEKEWENEEERLKKEHPRY